MLESILKWLASTCRGSQNFQTLHPSYQIEEVNTWALYYANNFTLLEAQRHQIAVMPVAQLPGIQLIKKEWSKKSPVDGRNWSLMSTSASNIDVAAVCMHLSSMIFRAIK